MASSTYLPREEGELIQFSTNFSTVINADPTAVGLTLAQSGAYGTLHTAFVSAWNTVNNSPNGRTPGNVAVKNTAKENLIDGPGGIRELVDIIQGFPGTTDVERTNLWLTIRDVEPTPAPIPGTAPTLTIISAIGQQVSYIVRDPADPDRRAKPDRVGSYAMFYYVGETAPVTLAGWQWLGNFGKTDGVLTFSALTAPAGAKVWLTAAWVNTRNQAGPLSTPQSVFLAGGLSQAA